jgi:hypothetical protein
MLHGDTKARSFGIQLTVYTSATAFILMTIGWVSSSLSAHASAVHSSIPCHLATVSLVVSFEFVALLSNIVVFVVSLAYTVFAHWSKDRFRVCNESYECIMRHCWRFVNMQSVAQGELVT